MISVKNLCYSYQPDADAYLQDVSLDISPGEYIALIGPNGSGKTTFLKHLNALLLPSRGEVLVDGMTSIEGRHHSEIRRRVGMVFQNPDNQIVGMSVEEDVAFGPGNLRLPSAEIRRRVGTALELVGLNGYEKRFPHTLSGGEKQLLALAGLLAMNPSYILLDEATSSLDPGGSERVLKILNRLRDEGIAVVNVTHNMEEALQAERVVLMADGQLVADGSAAQILMQRDLLKKVGLIPPLLVELSARLHDAGYQPSKPIMTVEDAVEEIEIWLQHGPNGQVQYNHVEVNRDE
jgi:biotin transport system ATP-binding protein/energy-coupling factor transport system ATP-binding protein